MTLLSRGRAHVRFASPLSPDERASLLATTLEREQSFVDSSTAGREDHRRSQVLYTMWGDVDRFVAAMRAVVPEACRALGVDELVGTEIEAQVTTHGDGDFYKVHTDDGSREAAGRVLTYAYYYGRPPKAFTGGELAIHLGEERELVVPDLDTLVFFLAKERHEILPLRVPSGAFADGRFTINGWVWRPR